MSISTALDSEEKVDDFFVTLTEELHKLKEKNAGIKEYIPPVIYHEKAKAYNVDYNFLISVLAYHVSDENVLHDFTVKNKYCSDNMRNAHFLIRSIFEDYHRVARVNNYKIDVGRYRNAKSIDVSPRFCNIMGMKLDRNVRHFSAIPFSKNKLDKLVNNNTMQLLYACAYMPQVEQVFFGEHKYREFLRLNQLMSVAPVY